MVLCIIVKPFETEESKACVFSWLHGLFLDIVVSKELYKNQAIDLSVNVILTGPGDLQKKITWKLTYRFNKNYFQTPRFMSNATACNLSNKESSSFSQFLFILLCLLFFVSSSSVSIIYIVHS